VELRGLEPLTFSLRRHRLQWVRREHRVLDLHVVRHKHLGCNPAAHMGHTAEPQGTTDNVGASTSQQW
jgi:hypothetical protein